MGTIGALSLGLAPEVNPISKLTKPAPTAGFTGLVAGWEVANGSDPIFKPLENEKNTYH